MPILATGKVSFMEISPHNKQRLESLYFVTVCNDGVVTLRYTSITLVPTASLFQKIAQLATVRKAEERL